MDKKRKAFRKRLSDLPIEEAHGGTGSRQLILSEKDDVSKYFSAMTKGFLEPEASFDWHSHEEIDELFIVLKGTGVIHYEDGESFNFVQDEIYYSPANLSHKIDNTGDENIEFFFIRLSA